MSDTTSQAAGNTTATGGAQTDAGASSGTSGAAAAPAAAAPASSAAASASTQQAPAGQTASDPTGAAASTTGQQGAQGEGGKPAATPGAPEKYEFKPVEGIALSEAVIGKFSTLARELNLPQEAAQKVLNELAPTLAQDNAKAIVSAMDKAATDWAQAAQTDKEIGGEKFKENLAVASKAFERFATPELRALLNRFDPKGNDKGTGLGNHPEVLRMFYRIGKAISEDKFVNAEQAPKGGERDQAAILYSKPKA